MLSSAFAAELLEDFAERFGFEVDVALDGEAAGDVHCFHFG